MVACPLNPDMAIRNTSIEPRQFYQQAGGQLQVSLGRNHCEMKVMNVGSRLINPLNNVPNTTATIESGLLIKGSRWLVDLRERMKIHSGSSSIQRIDF